jgi:uncharacterized protein YdaU (DUF1376 family)
MGQLEILLEYTVSFCKKANCLPKVLQFFNLSNSGWGQLEILLEYTVSFCKKANGLPKVLQFFQSFKLRMGPRLEILLEYTVSFCKKANCLPKVLQFFQLSNSGWANWRFYWNIRLAFVKG